MPYLYLIAGPNGAGKTTASLTILPGVLDCREFVNADAIAAGLSPLNPESVALEAGRLMLQRIRVLLGQRVDFALETTLSTKSYAGLVRDAQAAGYEAVLLFFYLSSPELAKERVRNRVAQGGHSIPETTIERRYERGLANLFNVFYRWLTAGRFTTTPKTSYFC
jgi:predicted ABC-type ATPase